MQLSADLEHNIRQAHFYLPFHKSFDLIERKLMISSTKSYYICINGFCQTDLIQRVFSDLQNPLYVPSGEIDSIIQFTESKIGYSQVQFVSEWEALLRAVLSGVTALFLDGFDRAILIDMRTYPARGVEEPENEKITRGAKDGFVETLLLNTSLIRRRVRSRRLTFELVSVGSESKTDVAIAYVDRLQDPKLLQSIKNKIESLRVTSLTMGIKSLEELMVKKSWFHPLPNVLLTERPDVACSYLMEGHILLIVDNSPYAMILPCTIFQFTQSPEDYNKSPVVGTYLRLVRFACIPIGLLLLPIFLLLGIQNPQIMITTEVLTPDRLFVYVILIEFILELFKTSSSLSSGRLSGSLSIVGGLIIGDVAVQMEWASLEVIFYGAITMLATLSLSNREFGEAIRVYRVFLLLLTGLLHLPGFMIGLILIMISVITTPTFGQKSYFWPLIPFDAACLKTLLFRYPTYMAQPGDTARHKTK